MHSKTNPEHITKIRSLIYSQQQANIEIAYQLLVNVVKVDVAQALRILFVELITLRGHLGSSGKMDDPFVDFKIYDLQIRYFWDVEGVYYYTQGQQHCFLELDRYHLPHPNRIKDMCIRHFHQHIYEFEYLVKIAMKPSQVV
ncbi:MAG TPA: hypothetical protein DCS93_43125 [Microscillaceae bacterium]|nr:hypothetical protein [Microscillaceae bacterium]